MGPDSLQSLELKNLNRMDLNLGLRPELDSSRLYRADTVARVGMGLAPHLGSILDLDSKFCLKSLLGHGLNWRVHGCL